MADDKYTYLRVPEEYYYEFYSKGPKGIVKNTAIFAQGSTASRTRLYQMNILLYWKEINKASFIIQGYLNRNWQSFEKGINFEAFIIRKKF